MIQSDAVKSPGYTRPKKIHHKFGSEFQKCHFRLNQKWKAIKSRHLKMRKQLHMTILIRLRGA